MVDVEETLILRALSISQFTIEAFLVSVHIPNHFHTVPATLHDGKSRRGAKKLLLYAQAISPEGTKECTFLHICLCSAARHESGN
jgi:hypothetical protein